MGSGWRSGGQHQTGQLLPQGSHIPVTAQSSRVILPNRSLYTRGDQGMLVGLGRSPVSTTAALILRSYGVSPFL